MRAARRRDIDAIVVWRLDRWGRSLADLVVTLQELYELGYLPIDKTGADLLFQVISLRYEQGALIITSNRAFKEWPTICNHDSTLTSAVLDRLLHHADTIIIEGKSFRMKDQLES
jgi:DNA replication protein DnaC